MYRCSYYRRQGAPLKIRHCNDRKLRDKALIFLQRLRQDEHIADEHAVPGKFGHKADRQAVVFVCAAHRHPAQRHPVPADTPACGHTALRIFASRTDGCTLPTRYCSPNRRGAPQIYRWQSAPCACRYWRRTVRRPRSRLRRGKTASS